MNLKPSPTGCAVRRIALPGGEAPTLLIRAGVSSDAPTGSGPELKLNPSLGIWQTNGALKAWYSVIHSL